MITITTRKWHKDAEMYLYKDYYVIDTIKAAMDRINAARENNDITKYGPIEIVNITDTEE